MVNIERGESGDYDYHDEYNLASVLQDMYYISASEKYELPYCPQFTRLNFSKRFPNYFDMSFRTKLYRRVAEALKSTITEVFDDLNGQIAFVPPFSALVLEQARRTSTSIKERKRLREKERLILAGAAASFDRPKTIRLEGVIRYIPELIKPITAPLDPTKYSADLLLKPIQWLAEWWRRRPISRVFDLAAKVEEINEYGRLVNRVFGNRFYYARSWDSVLSSVVAPQPDG